MAGRDRPILRGLANHVIPSVATRWHDLGLKLLDTKYHNELNIIEANDRNNVVMCCRKMFSKWLDTDELASWDKLIKAVRTVQLNNVASDIEKLSLQGIATLRVFNVSFNDIGDDGMADISEALQNNRSLTELKVYGCGLSVKGANYISQLLNGTCTLQVLDIGRNVIGDDGIAVISEALQLNRSLTTLNVHDCGLSAEGAISISYMMMVNYSLQELNMSSNRIGDDGISAIASKLDNCKINLLKVEKCGITLTGAESLARALSSHPTIRELWLDDNPTTVQGSQLIVEAAVRNTVCSLVYVDQDSKNDKVMEMLCILADRKRRKEDELLQQQEDSTEINSNNSSDEEPIVPLPIIAGGGQTVHMSMETSLMTPTKDDNHSGGGWEEQ